MAVPSSTSQYLHSNSFQAQNVNIHHNVQQTLRDERRPDPIHILHKHVAFGALYDSDERFDPPKCHPQTWTAIINRIEQWAGDVSRNTKPMLWLTGPAGAGKSAIAQTLVERWKGKDVTVLAFFFWRTGSHRNHKARLVPTIAFQLLELFPSTRRTIGAAIDAGGLFERSLQFQLDKLVIKPLKRCTEPQGEHPVVIVIDGLDECCIDLPGQDYESQQREILEELGSACQRTSYLRLLIVSRPERQIRNSFATELLEDLSFTLSLKNSQDAPSEIRYFLDCKFHEIRRQHDIEASWPSEAQLAELVRKSSGQFIYPSIAIKHIARARANPIQSLEAVLDLNPSSVDNPLAELDMLYTLVLKSVSAESLPIVTVILGHMLLFTDHQVSECFSDIFDENSVAMFMRFLFLSKGEVIAHLTDLHSVIDIPRNIYRSIRFLHATFSEYLTNEFRSGHFFIREESISVYDLLMLFRHWKDCSLQPGFNQKYDINWMSLCLNHCIRHCSPSKDVMIQLWNLLQVPIGHSSSAGSHLYASSSDSANKRLSNFFVSELKKYTGRRGIRDISKYLQKCNIPEFEPSLWRRLLVRLYLSTSLLRYL